MRARVIELAKKGEKPKDIQAKLQREYGEHALGRSSIYKWAARGKLGHEGVEDEHRSGRPSDDQLLTRVADTIENTPFASVAYIAQTLNSNKGTIYRYLTSYLGRVYKHSRWVPHLLDNDQKKKRVDQAKLLLEILNQCKNYHWANIITGDQSWFNYSYGEAGAWLLPEEEAPVMDGSRIQIQKIMITVIWGVNGIYLIDALPEKASFNSSYFISNIITPLKLKKKSIWSESDKRKIWLHLDNCRVHNSVESLKETEAAGFKRTPHPPYSPDIAPSDFFLFGYTKQELKGHCFTDRHELFEAICEIIYKISKEKREEVFDAWMRRCEYVINHKGEYYHE